MTLPTCTRGKSAHHPRTVRHFHDVVPPTNTTAASDGTSVALMPSCTAIASVHPPNRGHHSFQRRNVSSRFPTESGTTTQSGGACRRAFASIFTNASESKPTNAPLSQAYGANGTGDFHRFGLTREPMRSGNRPANHPHHAPLSFPGITIISQAPNVCPRTPPETALLAIHIRFVWIVFVPHHTVTTRQKTPHPQKQFFHLPYSPHDVADSHTRTDSTFQFADAQSYRWRAMFSQVGCSTVSLTVAWSKR